ncbi:glutathione S-transferase [Pantoea agglomerans]|uniref:glutathione S-transferase n=1 Tax=Enterobacter agglomerans TaxID=549 RepID=UPI00090710A7|nr:glutathione S-transferase N-terminal domain-containing protein [Pantoea agglomerans]
MSFKLYYARQSCAMSVHLALEEFSFDYDAILIKLRSKENLTNWFKEINPAKRVPVLVTPRGTITETPAILGYIHLLINNKRPSSFDEFTFCKLSSLNCWLSSTMHVAHAHSIRGDRWASSESSLKEMAFKTRQNMEDCCLFIENFVLNNSYFSVSNYSVSNSYMFVMTYYAIVDGVDITKYPKLFEHWNFVLERASTKKILDLHRIDLTTLGLR